MFDARRYTNDSLIKELLLLELHIRDGSVYECGCSWDAHLPLIEGLSQEGVKFAMSEKEKELFDELMHTARKYRLKLQYGIEDEGMEIEGEEHSSNAERIPYEIMAKTLKKYKALRPIQRYNPTLVAHTYLCPVCEKEYRYEKDAYDCLYSHSEEEIDKAIEKMGKTHHSSNPQAKYEHERIIPSEQCEPSSFRTVVRNDHRVVICCPKGEYDHELKVCKVGTIAQSILHPIGEQKKELKESE